MQNAIILKAWRTVRVYLNGGNAKKALPVDVEADDLSEAIKVGTCEGVTSEGVVSE